jgi:Na+-driven multidrug efflux pump
LSNALVYSDLVFGASVLIWIVNLLSAALRGAGNVIVPAALTALGALMTLILSPLLIFGWGPIPGFGVAGAGIAMIAYYCVAAAALVAYVQSSRSPVRLRVAPLQWRHFRSILGVGLLSAVGTLSSNVTVMIAVGFVGGYGAAAIAGYGIGSRPDYLLIPLLFALGTASVTLVGMNIGAGQVQRARRIAWIAAILSAAGCAAIGAVLFVAPQLWSGMFSHQADVVAAANGYLHFAAPMYFVYGTGIALYFAAQGAGRMVWPIVAGLSRLGFILAGGWYWVSVLHGGLAGLFVLFASSYIVFGGINLVAFATGASWKRASS